ncbi:hypothetical protein DCAR_0310557 [Daucus carota subsp. sativus]|uniref:Uncharacterized protein n=1 Tax=Daucus carota subsp. sativus TaxID=79200 RepID=A0A162AGH5_DAUCS|nr:hypothetical protein DCAR_0310557 [Daucus carota subsp. sativus]
MKTKKQQLSSMTLQTVGGERPATYLVESRWLEKANYVSSECIKTMFRSTIVQNYQVTGYLLFSYL